MSSSRTGSGTNCRPPSISSSTPSAAAVVTLERLQTRHAHHRGVITRELVLGQQLTHLELDQLEQLLVIDHVDLVQRHHDATGTPTWRASSTCSRVWGIGPSVAATTRIAPSTWAAPVIMFLM